MRLRGGLVYLGCKSLCLRGSLLYPFEVEVEVVDRVEDLFLKFISSHQFALCRLLKLLPEVAHGGLLHIFKLFPLPIHLGSDFLEIIGAQGPFGLVENHAFDHVQVLVDFRIQLFYVLLLVIKLWGDFELLDGVEGLQIMEAGEVVNVRIRIGPGFSQQFVF